VLAGCGGFSNGPLKVGEVRGHLASAEFESAFVAVLGAPAVRSSVDRDGNFSLREVETGVHELLAVGSDDLAARFEVTVEPARVLELGTLALVAAGSIEAQVLTADEHLRLSGAMLTVAGTPWENISMDSDGRAQVKGVPRGCWTVTLEAPGLGTGSKEACLNDGQAQRLDFDFPAPDGSDGREGCRVLGCEDGYGCNDDGACR
jgi:hypothetical protein